MILSNKKAKRRFTDLLYDLICNRKMELQKALTIMSENPVENNKNISRAAKYIKDSLIEGAQFSCSLRVCNFIHFDSVYISFIRFAERSGNLEEVLFFLKERCKREEENRSQVIEASVYPLFVIIFSIIVVLLLIGYSSSVVDSQIMDNILSENVYSGVFASFIFLILFCFTVILILRKMLGNNKFFEAFLAIGFLVKGGENLSNAVGSAVNILGFNTKEGKMFYKAKENLSYGISLKNAFVMNSWNKSVKNEMEEAFFYAENSGGENDVFQKIASWLKKQDEKRRKICFKLIEPFFVSGTGIFLIIFLVNIVVPLYSQTLVF